MTSALRRTPVRAGRLVFPLLIPFLVACSAGPVEELRHAVVAVPSDDVTFLLVEKQLVVTQDDGPRVASRTPHAAVAIVGAEVRLVTDPERTPTSFTCSAPGGETSDHRLDSAEDAITLDGEVHPLDRGRLLVVRIAPGRRPDVRARDLPPDLEEAAFLRLDVTALRALVRDEEE